MIDLARIAQSLVATGKGILAADETPSTLTRRLDAYKIPSTPTSRRDFRMLMLTTRGVDEFLSGVILQDETIRQQGFPGEPIPALCTRLGILPGIKVDAGARPLAGHDGEFVTEGLDNLRDRLAEYHRLGALFAKWHAVIAISDIEPSHACIEANAHALARYAALCQEQQIVPIVEPEVMMDGSHSIERCYEVTSMVHQAVFAALFEQGVQLEAMLLKPNMVIAGDDAPRQAHVDVAAVAAFTLRCLRRHVPPAVPGVVFLSGGQGDIEATRNLDAINRSAGPKPWRLSFSYGRALQAAALATWGEQANNVAAAQRVFYHRAKCNSLAAVGAYNGFEEEEADDVGMHRLGFH